MLDKTDIVSANGTLDSPVLLSERTQLLLITAIDYISSRYAWDDMSDSEWDDLFGYIGAAQSQVLTISESSGAMGIEKKYVERSTDFVISGSQSDVAIAWDTGDYDATNNSRVYVENSGLFIISGSVDIYSANANRATLLIRKNGTVDLGGSWFAPAVNQSYPFTVSVNLVQGDYIELTVTTNGTLEINVDDWTPKMSLLGIYQ